MTAINGMRFNQYSGILVCDEQRTWNDEMMLVNSCDKIRSIIRTDIQNEMGLVACYGNTGTSSLGDEFNVNMRLRIAKDYDEYVTKQGKKPDTFKSMEEVALIGFEIQTMLKRRHIDEQIKGKFGFTANDFVAGKYKAGEKEITIHEKDIIDTVPRWMTWEGRSEEVTPVFLNAGIIGGYSPVDGFRIFLLSLIEPVCEPVGEIFLAEGSGLDITDHLFTKFTNAKSIPERRGDIDRVEGTVMMIEGLNEAQELCVGVGGYIKLVYVDGRESDNSKRIKEIADLRSKLASEIVLAMTNRLIARNHALELIDDLIFKDKPFWDVNETFLSAAQDAEKLVSFLRGYRV